MSPFVWPATVVPYAARATVKYYLHGHNIHEFGAHLDREPTGNPGGAPHLNGVGSTSSPAKCDVWCLGARMTVHVLPSAETASRSILSPTAIPNDDVNVGPLNAR